MERVQQRGLLRRRLRRRERPDVLEHVRRAQLHQLRGLPDDQGRHVHHPALGRRRQRQRVGLADEVDHRPGAERRLRRLVGPLQQRQRLGRPRRLRRAGRVAQRDHHLDGQAGAAPSTGAGSPRTAVAGRPGSSTSPTRSRPPPSRPPSPAPRRSAPSCRPTPAPGAPPPRAACSGSPTESRCPARPGCALP
ncbi:hypothetical protein [Nocardioides convexus]|uniref:hypothetical protein n=1 Tax=Nocardioides convexus TaxID=2712224 RepID=UPI0024188420|nr:hypothetical protein [Nocardioides convexus]